MRGAHGGARGGRGGGPPAVLLPPILGQRFARRRLAIARSALIKIVSVTRVSNPLRIVTGGGR
jgi:hypothetical protein